MFKLYPPLMLYEDVGFLAQQQGKQIAPITAADMSYSVSRNPFGDAHFAVYVTGKVAYLSGK